MTSKPPRGSAWRSLRRAAGRIPILGTAARYAWTKLNDLRFKTSGDYWEARYAAGGNSGAGSYGRLAEWKAEILNALVRKHALASVIEFGCGDGAQLALARYPAYTGIDVAPSAVRLCIERFRDDATKSFFAIDPRAMRDPLGKLRADMALSLDVLYHLVEDEVRDAYLERLFQAGSRFVVIFSSDGPSPTFGAAHERHRAFTPWVREHCPEWSLVEHIPNPYPMGNAGDDQQTSPADFFVFRRNASAAKEPS